MYSLFPSLTATSENSGIKYMKVFYDTLFLCVRSLDADTNTFYDNLVIEKIDADITNSSSAGIVVKIGQSQTDYSGNNFVGCIFDEELKKVYFSVVLNQNSSVVPRLYSYSINDHKVSKVYPLNEDEWTNANLGNPDSIQKPIIQKSDNKIDILFPSNDGTNRFFNLLVFSISPSITAENFKRYTIPNTSTDIVKDFKRLEDVLLLLVERDNTIVARKLVL